MTASERRTELLLMGSAFLGNMFFERAIWIIYLHERGYSLFQVGLLESILHAAVLVFEIPTGVVADFIGRKKSIIIGRCLSALYLVGMVFAARFPVAAGFPVAAASFLVFGLGLTFISGADVALLYDFKKSAGEAEDFTRAIGVYDAGVMISLAVAMAAGGALRLVSWPLVFGLAALFQMASAALCCFVREAPAARPRGRAAVADHAGRVLAFVARRSPVRALMIVSALYTGVVSTYHLLSQRLLTGVGFAVAAVAGILALESLVSAFVSSRAHAFEARLGSGAVMRYALGASALVFPMVALTHPGTAVASLFVLSPLAELFYPVSVGALNREIPSEQRATLMSVVSFASSSVMLFLFPSMGYAADRFGLGGALAVSGSTLAALCLAIIGRRQPPARSPRDPARRSISATT